MTENLHPEDEPMEGQVAVVKADPRRPYKAIAAFVLTVLGLLWAALAGRDTLTDMSLMEWLSIIVPTILTTGAVYGISNPATIQTVQEDTP